METIKVKLVNCYGISSLEHEFDFKVGDKNIPRAYAIYAPNGTMKTSFTKTFENLSNVKEERYNRPSTCSIEADGKKLSQDAIYVLKSEIDISTDSPSITNILVDPKNKAQYDSLLIDLDKLKNKLIRNLQALSGIKQSEVEQVILQDWQEEDFTACIEKIKNSPTEEDLSPYIYNTIFDPKALAILKSKEFTSKADEFNRRYQELFEQAGSLYQKGIFNPNKAETSFNTLNIQFFYFLN